jgi:hypothetical protein
MDDRAASLWEEHLEGTRCWASRLSVGLAPNLRLSASEDKRSSAYCSAASARTSSVLADS